MRTIAKVRQTTRHPLQWSVVVGLVWASMLGAAPAKASTTAVCADANPYRIPNISDQWNAALASGNLSQLVDLYDDRAALMARPGEHPRSGKPAINAYYKELLLSHPQASVISRTIENDCNSATESGVVVYRITGKRKGTRMLLGGRYTIQYRLENGAWRITRHDLGANPRSAGETLVGQT